MEYVPAPAGSYALSVIDRAPDGEVVGHDVERRRLAEAVQALVAEARAAPIGQ
jgi:hypothetical protein